MDSDRKIKSDTGWADGTEAKSSCQPSCNSLAKSCAGIRAVIFDLDGVICHTDEYHYQAWLAVARRLGIPFVLRIHSRLRGVCRMESLNIILGEAGRHYTEEEKQRLAEEKNRIYREMLGRMTPEDLSGDVKSALNGLRLKGIGLAVGSSSRNTSFILERLGLSDYFDAVADGTQITRSKPDPEVFLLAADKLGVQPARALVVEDAAAGIEAARAGGFPSAAIGEAASRMGADYVLEKISDVLKLV